MKTNDFYFVSSDFDIEMKTVGLSIFSTDKFNGISLFFFYCRKYWIRKMQLNSFSILLFRSCLLPNALNSVGHIQLIQGIETEKWFHLSIIRTSNGESAVSLCRRWRSMSESINGNREEQKRRWAKIVEFQVAPVWNRIIIINAI